MLRFANEADNAFLMSSCLARRHISHLSGEALHMRCFRLQRLLGDEQREVAVLHAQDRDALVEPAVDAVPDLVRVRAKDVAACTCDSHPDHAEALARALRHT